MGGGAELSTTTDFRLVRPGASVSFVQARMGLAPGWGGARRLVELLGRRKALQLLLTCSKLGTEEGTELGYFDAVLGGGDPVSQAELWLLGRSKVIFSKTETKLNIDHFFQSTRQICLLQIILSKIYF